MELKPPSFSLFPIENKVWIDTNFGWLMDQFGRPTVLSCMVLTPSDEYFPQRFVGDHDSAEALLDQLCHYLSVEPSTVELVLLDPDDDAKRTHRVADGQIRVAADLLQDVGGLVGALCKELTNIRLAQFIHRSEDTRDDEEDQEYEAQLDLATVLLGCGILVGNSSVKEESRSDGLSSTWRVQWRSKLSLPHFGYALAVLADLQNDERPTWVRHLRPDIKVVYQQARSFFTQHGSPDLRWEQSPPVSGEILPSYGEESDPRDETAEVTYEPTSQRSCIYCGEATDNPPNDEAICAECLESIDENTEELEADQRYIIRLSNILWNVIWTLFVLVAIAVCAGVFTN